MICFSSLIGALTVHVGKLGEEREVSLQSRKVIASKT